MRQAAAPIKKTISLRFKAVIQLMLDIVIAGSTNIATSWGRLGVCSRDFCAADAAVESFTLPTPVTMARGRVTPRLRQSLANKFDSQSGFSRARAGKRVRIGLIARTNYRCPAS
jgi:hypothetical protein